MKFFKFLNKISQSDLHAFHAPFVGSFSSHNGYLRTMPREKFVCGRQQSRVNLIFFFWLGNPVMRDLSHTRRTI